VIRPSTSYEPRCPAQSALCQIVRDLLRAVFRVLRARARDDGVEEGRGGGVAVIQRFGGALNLNVHVHALILDGVFARDRAKALRFHRSRCLTTLDVEEALSVQPVFLSDGPPAGVQRCAPWRAATRRTPRSCCLSSLLHDHSFNLTVNAGLGVRMNSVLLPGGASRPPHAMTVPSARMA